METLVDIQQSRVQETEVKVKGKNIIIIHVGKTAQINGKTNAYLIKK